ncbi:hypothetical protein STEG23_009468 [Scotinomys teguina]
MPLRGKSIHGINVTIKHGEPLLSIHDREDLELTFGPFDTTLSEQGQFSSLYQVAPKDTSLTLGIVSLMLYFHWNWVGLFIIDDDKGAQTLSDLRSVLKKNRVCIAFVEMILVSRGSFLTTSWKNQVQILESSANVIIIYGDTDSLLSLIVNIKQRLLMWKVWVLNSQWDHSKFDNYFLLDVLHGALIFSHHNEINNFTDFIQTANPSKYPEDIYLHVLWNSFFNCSFLRKDCKIVDNCLPNVSLAFLPGNIFDMTMSEESYNVYNAVYAVAHSLHEIIFNQVQNQPHENGKEMVFFPWKATFSYPEFSVSPYEVENYSFHVYEELSWDFDGDCIESVNRFWNVPCIPTLSKAFIMKGCWILSNAFSASNEMIMCCYISNFISDFINLDALSLCLLVGPFHGVPDFLDILFNDLFGFGVFLDCRIYFLYCLFKHLHEAFLRSFSSALSTFQCSGLGVGGFRVLLGPPDPMVSGCS